MSLAIRFATGELPARAGACGFSLAVLFPLCVVPVIWILSPIAHMSHEVQGHRHAFS